MGFQKKTFRSCVKKAPQQPLQARGALSIQPQTSPTSVQDLHSSAWQKCSYSKQMTAHENLASICQAAFIKDGGDQQYLRFLNHVMDAMFNVFSIHVKTVLKGGVCVGEQVVCHPATPACVFFPEPGCCSPRMGSLLSNHSDAATRYQHNKLHDIGQVTWLGAPLLVNQKVTLFAAGPSRGNRPKQTPWEAER